MRQRVIPVKLTVGEWAVGAQAGFHRQLNAHIQNNKASWKDGKEVTNHMLGSLGEACFHKHLGVWWPAPLLDGYSQADAAGNIQIRTTASEFYKVKPEDEDHWMAVFFRGSVSSLYFEMVGCMKVEEAKRRYPLKDYGNLNKPCHRIPVEDLYSVEEFLKVIDQPELWPGDGK